MTKRESILLAIMDALTNVPNVTAFRSRTIPFSKGLSPALIVEPIQDIPDSDTIPFLTWALQFRVTVIVRDDVPDQAGDEIVEAVHGAILADTSLGGLSMDIQPVSVNYEIIDADNTLGLIALDFRVTYRTAFASLA